jgi:CheY-like chemotaxis protein
LVYVNAIVGGYAVKSKPPYTITGGWEMPRVLIIDGDESTRETLAIFTEMLGIEPVVAINPASCDVYSSTPGKCTKEASCTDILFIDQSIPGMTGLELIQQQIDLGCKTAPQHKAIMSAALTAEELQQAKELGCHVLQKPVTFEVFEHLLDSLADEHRALVDAG